MEQSKPLVRVLAGFCAAALILAGCTPGERPSLVVYTSQDQVYAEPILREFERRTGIRIKALYDSEATKTVGLANRLIAERANPRCDVFWNNEELRTRQLDAAGVLLAGGPRAAFGYRSRRIVINTNRVALAAAPRSFEELTDPKWRGRVALAYPLFGTTATHFLVLRQRWGTERWEAWCRALAANDPRLTDGNSMVVRLVGRGEAAVGMTDWDDIEAGRRQGLPILALPLSDDTLLVRNTAAAVAGDRAELGARLIEYLASPETVQRLLESGAIEGADAAAAARVNALQPEWKPLLRDLDSSTEFLKRTFLH